MSVIKLWSIYKGDKNNIIWSWFGVIFLVIKFVPSMHFIWDSLWVSIEAVILSSPVLFQCRHVKQSFKGKSFSNKENNSKPTPDNVECDSIKGLIFFKSRFKI